VDLPVRETGKLFSSRVPPAACPRCGKVMDAATNLMDKTAPQGGDFSVCIYCAAVLRFTDDLDLRKATGDELAMLLDRQPEAFSLLIRVKVAARLCLRERAGRN